MTRGYGFVGKKRGVLREILPLLGPKDNNWVVDDIWVFGAQKNLKGQFSAEQFYELVSDMDDYCFIRIRRYPFGAEISDISDYTDYLKSECTLVLICVDGGVYEIYAKEQEDLLTLKRKSIELGHGVEVITDENDGRYSFHGC